MDGGPPVVTLVIRGPITRASLPGLTDRCCAFFAAQAGAIVMCEVPGVEPDAVCVDALARLQLVARHNGCTVVLRDASPELIGLVDLMGLADVLVSRPGAAADRTTGTASRSTGRT
jgi:ABC-type transporter Mla MlaB component